MQGMIIDFPQNILGCYYNIIDSFCGNYTSLHYSTYPMCCIEATVHSIR